MFHSAEVGRLFPMLICCLRRVPVEGYLENLACYDWILVVWISPFSIAKECQRCICNNLFQKHSIKILWISTFTPSLYHQKLKLLNPFGKEFNPGAPIILDMKPNKHLAVWCIVKGLGK